MMKMIENLNKVCKVICKAGMDIYMNILYLSYKIKKFIKGLRKIDYTYDLSYDKLTCSDILRKISDEDISKGSYNEYKTLVEEINYIPTDCNPHIGIDYTLEKVEEPTTLLLRSLSRTRSCKTLIKFNVEKFLNSKQRKIDAYIDIYTWGIDDRIWKYSFNPYVIYNYAGRDYDMVFFNLLIAYTNAAIKVLNLRKISKYPVTVDSVSECTPMSKKERLGYFCSVTPDFNLSNHENVPDYDIDAIIPEWSSDVESNEYFDAINDITGDCELNKKVTSAKPINIK